MVLERAEVIIKHGLMEEFLQVLRAQALPLTAQFTGCLSFRALRGVEDVDSVMLLAEWESIEMHVASRAEPSHIEFRKVVLPYTSGAKKTVHFAPV